MPMRKSSWLSARRILSINLFYAPGCFDSQPPELHPGWVNPVTAYQCVGDRILHTICCSRTMDLGLHIAVHTRKKSFLRHTDTYCRKTNVSPAKHPNSSSAFRRRIGITGFLRRASSIRVSSWFLHCPSLQCPLIWIDPTCGPHRPCPDTPTVAVRLARSHSTRRSCETLAA